MPAPARIVSIPSADVLFTADARRIATTIPGGLGLDAALHWYRLALRQSHPTAVVRTSDAHPERPPGVVPVWYVSRHAHQFRLDTSLYVPLPPDEAWTVYVERAPEWLAILDVVPRTTDGSPTDREYDTAYTFLGVHHRGVLRFLAAEPGWCLTVEIEGSGWTIYWIATFLPQHSGTLIQTKGGYEVPHNLLARLADRLWIEQAIARDRERANVALRALCYDIASREPVAAH
jgi:hypothetical protein